MNRGKFIHGLIFGFIIPPVAYLVMTGIYMSLESAGYASTEGFSPMFRERTTGVVAIGLNALLLNYFSNKNRTESARGLVIPTFIYVGVWFYFFKDIVLS